MGPTSMVFNFSALEVDQCLPENLGQLPRGRWFLMSATPENHLASFQNPSASTPAPLNEIRIPKWDQYIFWKGPGDCGVQPRLRHTALSHWLSTSVSVGPTEGCLATLIASPHPWNFRFKQSGHGPEFLFLTCSQILEWGHI